MAKSSESKGDGGTMIPKRAIVLAAGLGTRMRPYNGHIPKPLVAIGGKSLIDYALDRLADAGVERAVVNVHHLADALERHLAPRTRPQIVISDERGTLLGTGGGVAKALPQLGEAPFFLVNSDTIWLDGVKPNLVRLAAAFDPATMDALLLARADGRQRRLCRPRRFRHAARRPAAAARARTRSCRSSMPARRCSLRRCSPMRQAAPSRSRCCSTAPARTGACSGCALEGVWMHVGTPEAVAAAEATLAAAR